MQGSTSREAPASGHFDIRPITAFRRSQPASVWLSIGWTQASANGLRMTATPTARMVGRLASEV